MEWMEFHIYRDIFFKAGSHFFKSSFTCLLRYTFLTFNLVPCLAFFVSVIYIQDDGDEEYGSERKPVELSLEYCWFTTVRFH